CPEKDLAAWAKHREFPIIPCNLCGSQPNLQRQQINEMLRDWDRRFPGRLETMFRALSDVVPSHLMDAKLYDFAGLEPSGRSEADGDTALDEEDIAGLSPQEIEFSPSGTRS
ncbi:MAG: tRNA 2-thiocytidine(32) synthetase TtcA, partial [Rhodocyclaceae bacterium]